MDYIGFVIPFDLEGYIQSRLQNQLRKGKQAKVHDFLEFLISNYIYGNFLYTFEKVISRQDKEILEGVSVLSTPVSLGEFFAFSLEKYYLTNQMITGFITNETSDKKN